MSGFNNCGIRKLNISMNQGADFNLVITISGEDGPIDITGYSFLGEMRQSTEAGEPVVGEFVFTIKDQVLYKGQVQWSLPASTIEEIVTSTANPLEKCRLTTPFVYDVKMKTSGGALSRILEGIAYVSPQATQEDFT